MYEKYGEESYFTDLQLKTIAVLIEFKGNTMKAAEFLTEQEEKPVTPQKINNRMITIRSVIRKARNTVNRAQNLKKNPYLRKRMEDYV